MVNLPRQSICWRVVTLIFLQSKVVWHLLSTLVCHGRWKLPCIQTSCLDTCTTVKEKVASWNKMNLVNIEIDPACWERERTVNCWRKTELWNTLLKTAAYIRYLSLITSQPIAAKRILIIDVCRPIRQLCSKQIHLALCLAMAKRLIATILK